MNTKTLTASIFPILILVTSIFLSACQAVGGVPIVLAQPDTIEEIPVTGFDYEQAADNLAARWITMGRFYEGQGLLTREFDAEDTSAQRWSAMAKYYEDNSLAIAKYYEKYGLSQMDSDEILAYRWNAAAKFYQDKGLLSR